MAKQIQQQLQQQLQQQFLQQQPKVNFKDIGDISRSSRDTQPSADRTTASGVSVHTVIQNLNFM